MAFNLLAGISIAQENANVLIEVDFMKVKPGDEGSYVELEQKVWKPIHQERIKKGILVGWVLYQVMYTGANDEFNYVTVNVYGNTASLENPYQGMNFKEIHPGKDLSEELDKTTDTRTLVKKQLLSRANYAYPEGSATPAPHKYIVVNYMKTIAGGNFMQVENELAKPVSQELIKNGDWAGWSVWSNVFPRGTGMESNVVTVDYFADFSKIGSANYRQAFEKAHPGKEWSEFGDKVGNSRIMVRSELWKVIDSAFAEQ
jgi:hypothetical protein